jgi:hypothetical protein
MGNGQIVHFRKCVSLLRYGQLTAGTPHGVGIPGKKKGPDTTRAPKSPVPNLDHLAVSVDILPNWNDPGEQFARPETGYQSALDLAAARPHQPAMHLH